MTTRAEIFIMASDVMEEYGDDAFDYAVVRMIFLAKRGMDEDRRVWGRVLSAIVELRDMEKKASICRPG